MTDLRTAAQQALEALQYINTHCFILADHEGPMEQAIPVLRAALEQPEKEPVADSFTMDELTEAAVYAEIPDGPFQSLLIGLQEAVKQRAALKERNA